MTTSATIDSTLAKSFENASTELMTRIRAAIRDFYANPPQGWQGWEVRRTPKPWEQRAIPNLEKYHKELEAALRVHRVGDVKPIALAGASYAGLSKDMELDMDWMTEANRVAVHKALTELVLIADDVHRLGYAELSKSGRI